MQTAPLLKCVDSAFSEQFGSGFEDTPCNVNWFLLGNDGKNTYRNEASNRVCSADIQTARWLIAAAEWPNQGTSRIS